MSNKIFEPFLEKISEFPFWIKEIIYITLREEFEHAYLSEADLLAPLEENFQAFVPEITFAGKKELEERNLVENESVYRFLQFVSERASIAEITLKNFWTLENTSKLFVYCIQKEYIKKVKSKKLEATALFLAERIKTGEYFKRIGRISVDQLDQAIRKQKELEQKGEKKQFAEILIEMGFVTENETKAVIYLKEECKKRFIFNTNLLGKSQTNAPLKTIESATAEKGNKKDNAEFILLRKEIFELQTKLRDIAKIIKR